ncbi:MAG: DEAD/DEAH box helicase [Ostreibacterium sp.]
MIDKTQIKNAITTTSFSQFNIHPALQDALAQMDWSNCTPIQEKTLPLTLAGYDVAGKAQTGTGKTAAFLIAVYNYLMTNPIKPSTQGPWGIILAPTRELAIQIYQDALQIGCYTGLKPVVIYGGKDYETQKALFEDTQPDLIIGTPGRIIDLFKQRYFNLKNIECLVLDEADRMFDLGFISDIRYLMRAMPLAKERLNLIFSATFTYRVQELAYEYLNAPKMIEVESETQTAEHIEQTLYHLANNEKTPLLIGQLKQLSENDKVIVFLNTKNVLERLAHTLSHNGFKVAMLSGDIAQDKREKLLKAFQTGEKNILLATDVAARGLHIDDISHVFNYDLPQHPEDYIHRVGRTARAGKSGIAISFGCEDYAYHLPEIEEKLGEKIPTKNISDEMLADVLPAPDFVPEKYNPKPKNNRKQQNNKNHRSKHRTQGQGSANNRKKVID